VAVVIDPAPGVKLCLGENRLAARDVVAEAIGDPLVRARRAAIGRACAGLDRSEAGDVGGLADRLEQRPTAGARIADRVVRAPRYRGASCRRGT
jgi:hypothetical protein